MKKWISMILVLVMLLGLCACGAVKQGVEQGLAEANKADETDPPAEAAEPDTKAHDYTDVEKFFLELSADMSFENVEALTEKYSFEAELKQYPSASGKYTEDWTYRVTPSDMADDHLEIYFNTDGDAVTISGVMLIPKSGDTSAYRYFDGLFWVWEPFRASDYIGAYTYNENNHDGDIAIAYNNSSGEVITEVSTGFVLCDSPESALMAMYEANGMTW